MRGIFGWSYPPGAAGDPLAPWNQDDPPCDICKRDPVECICPECDVCGTQGDPGCVGLHFSLIPTPALMQRQAG